MVVIYIQIITYMEIIEVKCIIIWNSLLLQMLRIGLELVKNYNNNEMIIHWYRWRIWLHQI